MACGRTAVEVPWSKIREVPEEFFDPTYVWPSRIPVDDPSRIHKESAIFLLNRWRNGGKRQLRFRGVLAGGSVRSTGLYSSADALAKSGGADSSDESDEGKVTRRPNKGKQRALASDDARPKRGKTARPLILSDIEEDEDEADAENQNEDPPSRMDIAVSSARTGKQRHNGELTLLYR